MVNPSQFQNIDYKLSQLLSSSSFTEVIKAPSNLSNKQPFNYKGKRFQCLNSCIKGSNLFLFEDYSTGNYYAIAEEGSKKNGDIISTTTSESRHVKPSRSLNTSKTKEVWGYLYSKLNPDRKREFYLCSSLSDEEKLVYTIPYAVEEPTTSCVDDFGDPSNGSPVNPSCPKSSYTNWPEGVPPFIFNFPNFNFIEDFFSVSYNMNLPPGNWVVVVKYKYSLIAVNSYLFRVTSGDNIINHDPEYTTTTLNNWGDSVYADYFNLTEESNDNFFQFDYKGYKTSALVDRYNCPKVTVDLFKGDYNASLSFLRGAPTNVGGGVTTALSSGAGFPGSHFKKKVVNDGPFFVELKNMYIEILYIFDFDTLGSPDGPTVAYKHPDFTFNPSDNTITDNSQDKENLVCDGDSQSFTLVFDSTAGPNTYTYPDIITSVINNGDTFKFWPGGPTGNCPDLTISGNSVIVPNYDSFYSDNIGTCSYVVNVGSLENCSQETLQECSQYEPDYYVNANQYEAYLVGFQDKLNVIIKHATKIGSQDYDPWKTVAFATLSDKNINTSLPIPSYSDPDSLPDSINRNNLAKHFIFYGDYSGFDFSSEPDGCVQDYIALGYYTLTKNNLYELDFLQEIDNSFLSLLLENASSGDLEVSFKYLQYTRSKKSTNCSLKSAKEFNTNILVPKTQTNVFTENFIIYRY